VQQDAGWLLLAVILMVTINHFYDIYASALKLNLCVCLVLIKVGSASRAVSVCRRAEKCNQKAAICEKIFVCC